MQALYVWISVAALTAILVLLALNRRKGRRISTPTLLGMVMIVLGILSSDSRWIGYSLIGGGVVLAAIDATYIKSREEH